MTSGTLPDAAAEAIADADLAGARVTLRLGRAEDARPLSALNRAVRDESLAPFVPQDEPFFARALSDGATTVIAVMDGERLVGYSVGSRCGAERQPFTRRDACEPEATGLLLSTALLPAYRGRGLQSVLIRARIHALAAIGCRTIQTTAAPSNTPSLRNLMQAGFVIHELRPLFDGAARFVLSRPSASPAGEAGSGPASVVVPFAADALAEHQRLLVEGWRGYPLSGGAVGAAYRRPVPA